MAIKNYWRDIQIAKGEYPLLDKLFEKTPILDSAVYQATNDGMRHVVEIVKSADAAEVVELDGAIPEITSDTSLEDVKLGAIGGIMKVGTDAAKLFGGAVAYFGKKLGPILKKTGQSMETSLIYNTLRPYAISTGNVIDAGGTTADKMYSILAVRWMEDETSMLYDANGLGDGRVFDILPLTPATGSLLTIDGVEKSGFAQQIKMYTGTQMAVSDNVAMISNIDLTASTSTDSGFVALPTEAQMDELLELVDGDDGDVTLYMYPTVKSGLAVYKGGRLEMVPADDNFRRSYSLWEGTPIVTSKNFKKASEAVVS